MSGMFPNVNIQHLVVNLDGEVVWNLGKSYEGTIVWGNEENPGF